MADKSTRGFVPAVLSQPVNYKAFVYKGKAKTGIGRFARIFLLSRNKSNSKKKPKGTNNRKYTSTNTRANFEGVTYLVNSKPSGIYPEMLRRVVGELNKAETLWGRVLVVRIDLHQHAYTPESEQVSKFFKQMVRKLKKKYLFDQVGYFWVREHERAKAQHYHCWLFLDGGKVKHSTNVIRIAKETWVKNQAGRRHIPTTKKPFRLLENQQDKAEIIYWLSYGCKCRGKGYRPPQSKDYSTSRLKEKT